MITWNYEDAGQTTDPFQLTAISLSPDPPLPGKDLEVTIGGQILEPVQEGAYAEVEVKLGLIKLLYKRFDLGEELRKLGAKVPVPTGEFSLVHKVTLSSDIPRAKFKISARGYTVDDDELFTVLFTVDFTRM